MILCYNLVVLDEFNKCKVEMVMFIKMFVSEKVEFAVEYAVIISVKNEWLFKF